MLSKVLNFMILASHLQNMDLNLSSILSYHKKYPPFSPRLQPAPSALCQLPHTQSRTPVESQQSVHVIGTACERPGDTFKQQNFLRVDTHK